MQIQTEAFCRNTTRLRSPRVRNPFSGVSPAPDTSLIGQRIEYFRIVELVAEGGMGAVYRAQHIKLGYDVAIKVLHASLVTDPVMIRRFRREAELLSSMNDPHIVRVREYGFYHDLPYIIMDYLAGQTLDEVLRAQTHIHSDRAVSILLQICAAIAPLHARGIIHRDLKPSNIILQNGDAVKLFDLGVAREITASEPPMPSVACFVTGMTPHGNIIGTPSYMPPEQFKGLYNFENDIYSWGVIAYQMLAGVLPYVCDRIDIYSVAKQVPPVRLRERVPSVPPVLESIVMRALDPDPTRRFQTAGELYACLAEFQSGNAAARSAFLDTAKQAMHTLRVKHPAIGSFVSISLISAAATVAALFSLPSNIVSNSATYQPLPVQASTYPTVMVDCNPIGAQVFDETGTLLGTTPLEISFGPDMNLRDVTIRADGYKERQVTLSTEGQVVSVVLERPLVLLAGE